jgi:NAD(P)-dependent dehydrogenase (short-subunit alcohol dehydrogenase family)
MNKHALDLPETVLVTGAAGGIGSALIGKLVAAGSKVIGVDRVAQPRGLGCLAWIEADLSSEGGAEAIAEATPGGLGGIVYSAGVLDGKAWDVVDFATAQRLYAVNVLSPFFLVRALASKMAEGSSVVMLGSIAGVRASPVSLFYGASKAALRNIGASLSHLLQPHGVRVNVLAPGLIDTPLTDRHNADLANRRAMETVALAAERQAGIPMGRAGTPEEIAEACIFLLSRQSSYMTGSTMFVTGGVWAGSI